MMAHAPMAGRERGNQHFSGAIVTSVCTLTWPLANEVMSAPLLMLTALSSGGPAMREDRVVESCPAPASQTGT